ncbi:C-terminal binding protein [Gryllotalpicola reticulitermitis]|uniref:C-terminal binding protein n=1 Tax=Gryllotalpicola reticulitermitis TaxID=1184153 RepID=A0ABV8Q3R9_9MICO
MDRERDVAARYGCDFAEFDARSEEDAVRAVTGARVAFVNFAPMTRRVLMSMAPGGLVIRYGIGVDNVDLAAARELGVSVCNVPDYGADTVAEHAVTLLLSLLRRVFLYTDRIRSEGWIAPADAGTIRGFATTTVGLIGTGRIGRAVAARLVPFGFRIVAFDPFVERAQLEAIGIAPVRLDQLLSESHAVSLHAPLTVANHHLLNAERLAMMSADAVVVNTSRGGLIDESALETALVEGRLAGAALDVFEREPLPETSALRALPNVLLTPHAAFYSESSLANLQRLAAEEADRYLMGQPLRCPVTRLE